MRLRPARREDVVDRHPAPPGVELRPARHAMNIADDLALRQRVERRIVPGRQLGDGHILGLDGQRQRPALRRRHVRRADGHDGKLFGHPLPRRHAAGRVGFPDREHQAGAAA